MVRHCGIMIRGYSFQLKFNKIDGNIDDRI
jgi:hypothetical protein